MQTLCNRLFIHLPSDNTRVIDCIGRLIIHYGYVSVSLCEAERRVNSRY